MLLLRYNNTISFVMKASVRVCIGILYFGVMKLPVCLSNCQGAYTYKSLKGDVLCCIYFTPCIYTKRRPSLSKRVKVELTLDIH